MIQTKEQLQPFSKGIRCILLLQRKKEGGSTNENNRCWRRIMTRNSEEFFEAIDKLEIEKQRVFDKDGKQLRIYSSVNARNIDKSIRQFKKDQIDNDYNLDELRQSFYLDIKNRFIHCLMQHTCKAESNFMFDLDECCERSLASIEKELIKHTEILLRYPTKSGFHIVTKPFNYTKLENDGRFEIKTDGLLLISF
jgi:hypothetical protein